MNWIKTEDTMPEINRTVLFTHEDRFSNAVKFKVGCFSEDGRWRYDDHMGHWTFVVTMPVTHWAPLTKP